MRTAHPCHQHRIELVAQITAGESISSETADHVAGCAGCAQLYREESRLQRWIEASSVEHTPPAGLWTRIEQQVSRPEPVVTASGNPLAKLAELWRTPHFQTVAIAAGLVLVFSFFLFQLMPSGESELQMLAAVEEYSLEYQENPFLAVTPAPENPFLSIPRPSGLQRNPFDTGSQK